MAYAGLLYKKFWAKTKNLIRIASSKNTTQAISKNHDTSQEVNKLNITSLIIIISLFAIFNIFYWATVLSL